MQQFILQKYIEKFQLSNQEKELLQQSNITPEFFAALEKTQTVHNNCQILLRNGNQTLALSIMEQMTSLQVGVFLADENIMLVFDFMF